MALFSALEQAHCEHAARDSQFKNFNHPTRGNFMLWSWRVHKKYIKLREQYNKQKSLNEWLYPFTVRIFNIHGSGVLIALFGCCRRWCHVKLLPSRRRFCVHHSTIHQAIAFFVAGCTSKRWLTTNHPSPPGAS